VEPLKGYSSDPFHELPEEQGSNRVTQIEVSRLNHYHDYPCCGHGRLQRFHSRRVSAVGHGSHCLGLGAHWSGAALLQLLLLVLLEKDWTSSSSIALVMAARDVSRAEFAAVRIVESFATV